MALRDGGDRPFHRDSVAVLGWISVISGQPTAQMMAQGPECRPRCTDKWIHKRVFVCVCVGIQGVPVLVGDNKCTNLSRC